MRFARLWFLSLLCLGLTAASARAEDPRYLTVHYAFNAGGLSVGKARLTAVVQDGRYVATSRMRTAGLADVLFKSRYDILATGTVETGATASAVRPSRYDSDFEGSSGSKLVTLVYDNTGLPMPVVADPPYGKTQLKYPVPESDQRAAVDPMSAWVHQIVGIALSEAQPCGQVIPIYDGRRRYNLNYEFLAEETLTVTRGDMDYEGPAVRCGMVYEPVSGFKADQMDANDGLPIPPLQLWLAEMGPEGAAPFHVPLRLIAETPIGSVVMIAERVDFEPITDVRTVKRAMEEVRN